MRRTPSHSFPLWADSRLHAPGWVHRWPPICVCRCLTTSTLDGQLLFCTVGVRVGGLKETVFIKHLA